MNTEENKADVMMELQQSKTALLSDGYKTWSYAIMAIDRAIEILKISKMKKLTDKDATEFKITKASKILKETISKKDLLKRIEKLENNISDNTEVSECFFTDMEEFSIIEPETKKSLSIREVQVKVTSQEEANECAEIAKACGEEIGSKFSMSFDRINQYFFINIDKKFGIYMSSLSKIEITLQEFKELFSKPKDINWSKADYFYYVNELDPSDKVFCISQPEGWDISNDRMRIINLSESRDRDRLGSTSFVVKSALKLCTQPITLSN